MAVLFGAPAITAIITGETHGPLDVRPYLSGITCVKDQNASAGTFELDIPYSSTRAWLLDTIQPVDYIEITFANTRADPRVYRFRGFVDNVTDHDGISADGTPARSIIINGRDFGGRLQEYKIFYPITSADLPAAIIRVMSLSLKYGLQQSAFNLKPNSLMTDVFNKVLMAGFLQPLMQQNAAIPALQLHTAIPPQFGFDTLAIQSFMGSFDDLFRQYESPPWGEYFIRDDDDAPRLYLRVAPFYASDGALCWQSSAHEDVRYCLIRGDEVMDAPLSRSSNEVYTYFFTVSEGLSIKPEMVMQQGLDATQNPYYDGLTNPGRARRFGFQPLEPSTPWIPLDISGSGALADFPNTIKLLSQLNGYLVRAFGYGEYLRSGSLVTRGVHGARVGDYLFYERSGEIYYAQSMAVAWQEGQPIQTTYDVVRGQAGVPVQPTAFPAGAHAPAPAAPVKPVAAPPNLCTYAPGDRSL